MSTIYASFEQKINISKWPPTKLNILRFWPEKEGFRYSGKGITARISNGADGVYAVLFDKDNRKWIFNLYWVELNRRKQLLNWDAIYVRDLDGFIPFRYLPDGKYQLKVFKVEGDNIQMIGSKTNMMVKGM